MDITASGNELRDAAALQDQGPDEALTRVWEGMPGTDLDACLAAVQGTGHPEAPALARAVAEFAASGAPLSIEQVAELKVSLSHTRPPIWRRVRLPAAATLADLHQVIQVLFGWDGDHLHLFQVGKKQYSDQFTGLEQTGDEQAVRIREVLTPGAKDRLHVRLRSRLGTRDHAGADDPARPRPGLPRLRGVARRLPGRVLVRGRP